MPRPALLSALLLSMVFGSAATAASADATVKAQLDSMDLKYEVDKDGDFKLTFELEDGRTQLVFVRSSVEDYGKNRVREIWSPGYRYDTAEIDQKVANRLLEHSSEVIMGAWTRQKSMAMFVVKIPANASNDELRDAMEAAAACADIIEKELTPAQDEL